MRSPKEGNTENEPKRETKQKKIDSSSSENCSRSTRPARFCKEAARRRMKEQKVHQYADVSVRSRVKRQRASKFSAQHKIQQQMDDSSSLSGRSTDDESISGDELSEDLTRPWSPWIIHPLADQPLLQLTVRLERIDTDKVIAQMRNAAHQLDEAGEVYCEPENAL